MAMCCFFYPWKMSSCRRKWILFAMRHPAVRVFGDRGGERESDREREIKRENGLVWIAALYSSASFLLLCQRRFLSYVTLWSAFECRGKIKWSCLTVSVLDFSDCNFIKVIFSIMLFLDLLLWDSCQESLLKANCCWGYTAPMHTYIHTVMCVGKNDVACF